MERFAVGRRQTYYELFKACRLCGSGGGYKMPIVQGAPTPNDTEPELRHKIRDCCSIDVNTDDKMPPLICELCVDKVNDFYEFREMCRATNIKVRSSLGLPPQTFNQESSEDCILGVSGPLIYNSKELEMSQSMVQKPIKIKVSLKEKKVETLVLSLPDKRSTRKESAKINSQSLLAERLSNSKRRRGSESISPAAPIKKLRFSDSPSTTAPTRTVEKRWSSVNDSISKKLKETPKKICSNVCEVCKATFTKPFALKQHLITQHTANILSDKFGCTPCREWFATMKLADEHHKWHRISSKFYRCNRCSAEFKVLNGYTRHFAMKQCIPEEEVPDVICSVCQCSFITKTVMDQHKCMGPPFLGGHCGKCKKHFIKRLQLKRHENKCKGVFISPDVNPNNPHLKTLKSVQITMPKCDTLLERIKIEPLEDGNDQPIYNVSGLHGDGVLVKSEPPEDGFNDGNGYDMDIKHEIKEEYPDYNSDCGDTGFGDNYSSDGSGSEAETSHTPNLVFNPFARKNTTQVESLSFISLRSIFSNKMFKRKHRQKKRLPKVVKSETKNAFDALQENPLDTSKSPEQEIVEPLKENCTIIDKSLVTNENCVLHVNEFLVSPVENCLHNSTNENPALDGDIGVSKGEVEIDSATDKNDCTTLSSSIANQNCVEDEKVDQNTLFEKNISDDNLKSTVTNENVMDQIIVAAVEGSCDFASNEDYSIDKDIGDCEIYTGNGDNKSDSENNVNIVDIAGITNIAVIASESNITESCSSALQSKATENIENDVVIDRKNIVNEGNINHEMETDSNYEFECELLQTPLLSNKSTDDNNTVNIDNVNGTDILKVNSTTSINQCNSVKETDMPNLIGKSSDDADIDFDIDSMLQGDLGPLAMKKQNEMLSSRQTNIFGIKEDMEKINSEETSANENVLDIGIDSTNETLVNINMDKIQDLVHMNDEKLHTGDESTTINIPATESLDISLEQDIAIERSESDVLDLVSDSGDDCNIIDSPEKLKVLEDQLLTDDVDDININQIENVTSAVCNNDEKILLQNSDVDPCESDVKDFEIADTFSLFSSNQEDAISSCSKRSDIENDSLSESTLDKINLNNKFTNSLGPDKLISDMETDDIEMDTSTDNIDMNKLPNDMETDKLTDNIQI